MFSLAPTTPSTRTGSRSRAIAPTAQMTAAPPDMSYFISSIFARLQRDAAAVERQRLADEAEQRAVCSALVAHRDQRAAPCRCPGRRRRTRPCRGAAISSRPSTAHLEPSCASASPAACAARKIGSGRSRACPAAPALVGRLARRPARARPPPRSSAGPPIVSAATGAGARRVLRRLAVAVEAVGAEHGALHQRRRDTVARPSGSAQQRCVAESSLASPATFAALTRARSASNRRACRGPPKEPAPVLGARATDSAAALGLAELDELLEHRVTRVAARPRRRRRRRVSAASQLGDPTVASTAMSAASIQCTLAARGRIAPIRLWTAGPSTKERASHDAQHSDPRQPPAPRSGRWAVLSPARRHRSRRHRDRGALQRADVEPDQVQHVVIGQVLQAGQGQVPSRQAQIKGGIPKEVSSETVNKVCASGMRAAGSSTRRSALAISTSARRWHGVDVERSYLLRGPASASASATPRRSTRWSTTA